MPRVLGDDEPAEAGIREAHSLMEKLGIHASQLIGNAYVDLHASHAPTAGTRQA